MSHQIERSESANTPESGRNGPNIALILGGIVVILTLIFFLKNSQQTKLEFLLFTKTTTVRWSIFIAIVLGVLIDRLFGIWWRRRRRDN